MAVNDPLGDMIRAAFTIADAHHNKSKVSPRPRGMRGERDRVLKTRAHTRLCGGRSLRAGQKELR